MGGWKASGLGARHGAPGIRKYCREQSLLVTRLAPKKEVHFFDFRFNKGLNWYRAHFPFYWRTQQHNGSRRVLTGEASPY